MIAQAAGVSVMTVSRALRNLGKVSDRRRLQVRKIAEQLGYRPDPTVAKLMYHLRRRQKPAFQGLVCALTTVPLTTRWDFSDEVVAGARAQADALGYAFSLLHVDRSPEGYRSLRRVLRSRGAEGVMLLPLLDLENVNDWLEWDHYSVVTTSGSILAPKVHRIAPSQFANTLLLCRQLAERGYRRIGLVIDQAHDERVGHNFTAAVEWHGRHEAFHYLAPFIFDGQKPDPRKLKHWFRRERPDVLLASQDRITIGYVDSLGIKIPGPVGLARTSTTAMTLYSGMDELPAAIGATAVGQLTGLIQRGEKGVPNLPAITLLPGRWVEGTTCPRRTARAPGSGVAAPLPR